jgi:hypothetical protein
MGDADGTGIRISSIERRSRPQWPPSRPGGLHALSGAVWEEFDEAQVEPQELIDTADGVLAVMTFRGRGRQSGVEVNMEVFQLWTFEDGKVIRGQGFADREGALEAAGLRPSRRCRRDPGGGPSD